MMSGALELPQMRFLGVTPPVSTNPPTPNDLKLTAQLEVFLRKTGVFESDDEQEKREAVLGQLNLLVKQFVREVGEEKGLPEGFLQESGGNIFTFGSYRLGVHGKGADIDTLCVAPSHVLRSDFFGKFVGMLAAHPAVTELAPVPDAYVPVVRLKWSGISIDLVFARLASMTSIPPEGVDLSQHSILKTMDEKCILSVNGSRTTDEILRLVPSVPTFHTALRCIKLWAKKRAIYSNAMGYLGGIALALLTARICQLYPAAAPSTIVSRFFRIYASWDWPKPVYLKPIEDYPLPLKVWNPRIYPSDRNHRMPVITPAYPSMCSTHNVSASTLARMTDEFKRGAEIMMQIESHNETFAETDETKDEVGRWPELFVSSDFFAKHRFFFQILIGAEDEKAFRAWSGFVESRLRLFVVKLEGEPNIAGALPFPQSFDLVVNDIHDWPESFAKHRLNNLTTPSPTNVLKDEDIVPDKEEPVKTFYTAAFYVALVIAALDPGQAGARAAGPRRLILDRPVNDFKFMLTTWDKITPGMKLEIKDIKREALPDYVFEGQPRPPPPSAKKKPPTTNPQAQNENAKDPATIFVDKNKSPPISHNPPMGSTGETPDSKRSRSSDQVS